MRAVKTVSILAGAGLGCLHAVTPLTSVHPDWTRINLRTGSAASLQPRVSGLAFKSNGDLVIGHWGGIHSRVHEAQHNSIVYILSGVTGNTPSPTVRTFATGITDLMGLAVVDDRIFVSGGNRIVELLDADGNGVSEGTRNVVSFPYTPGIGIHQRHEFTFGLLHVPAENAFKVILSSTKYFIPDPADSVKSPNRGTLMSVNASTGAYSLVAAGFREATGLGLGPNGDLFTNDVAGNWTPACKLTHVQQGRFYGFKHSPDPKYPGLTVPSLESLPETRPAVYMPDEDMASAPGNPLFIPSGPYAGQFFMGDVHYGGIQRYFLEKVNGQYQGAAFQFTGGLETGMFRLAWGPDNMLYAGGIGDDGDWNWPGSSQWYGLQKLRYNNTSNVFEMIAVRSRPGGLEIEYNQPVGATASAASSYTVQSFFYNNTGRYTEPKQGNRTDAVGTIQVCSDNKRVFLPIANFSAGRIYWLRNGSVRSASGAANWTRETYYGNNAVGAGNPCDPPTPVDPHVEGAVLLNGLRWAARGRALTVTTPFAAAHEVRIRDARGALLAVSGGAAGKTHAFDLGRAAGRFVVIEAVSGHRRLRRAVALP